MPPVLSTPSNRNHLVHWVPCAWLRPGTSSANGMITLEILAKVSCYNEKLDLRHLWEQLKTKEIAQILPKFNLSCY